MLLEWEHPCCCLLLEQLCASIPPRPLPAAEKPRMTFSRRWLVLGTRGAPPAQHELPLVVTTTTIASSQASRRANQDSQPSANTTHLKSKRGMI